MAKQSRISRKHTNTPRSNHDRVPLCLESNRTSNTTRRLERSCCRNPVETTLKHRHPAFLVAQTPSTAFTLSVRARGISPGTRGQTTKTEIRVPLVHVPRQCPVHICSNLRNRGQFTGHRDHILPRCAGPRDRGTDSSCRGGFPREPVTG